MKDTLPDIKMSVKEVAEILDLDVRTIQLKTKELFPELIRPGRMTLLNEKQVTIVKLNCEKKFAVKTELEKELIIHQAMMFQQEKINNLTEQLQIMAPKARLADQAFRDKITHYSITDAGKLLDIRQSKMFDILRENRLLTSKNLPTQRAIDYDILKLKTMTINERNYKQAVMSLKNIKNFMERYL